MNVIILAAGRGSRLKNLTKTIPKCLLKINEKSLLSRQLNIYNSINEIHEIAIVRGYLGERVKDNRIKYYFDNHNWKNTSIVSSLYICKEILMKKECIISYGDIFFGKKIIRSLINNSDDIAISYDANFLSLWSKRFSNPLEDLETFIKDKNNFLEEIGGKTDNIKSIEGQYMGLLKIKPNGWKKIEKILSKINFDNLDITQLLNLLIKENIKIKVLKNEEAWGEVDTPTDLALYEKEYDI
tara:strand:- start:16269 stop:16991 length:723 start_codon:yes stop_codon:yes gene_type:complete